VMPSLTGGIVCVLNVWGWQEPEVDCLLLIFSLASLVACPFSFAYRHWPVCLDWRAGSDATFSRLRLQKGDLHEIQTVIDLSNTLKSSLHNPFKIERGQQNYVQKKSSWNTVDPDIHLTRIHTRHRVFQHWAS
jgi:hypothetical protein